MKKAFILLSLIGLLLGLASCKRAEVADPDWNSPVGFNVLVEGAVSPATMVIDGRIHTSQVVIRVTNSRGTPLAGKTILLQQLHSPDSDALVNWGYFQNNQSSYQQATDANGEIRVTFYWPVQYYSEEMWIYAVLMIDGRAVKESETGIIGNIPQDFISLTMFRSGSTSFSSTR